MSLIARLLGLVHPAGAPAPEAAEPVDERLAAAALLIHVAAVDGRVAPAERERLVGLLQGSGLDGGSAAALVARAERRRLVAMAYQVAAADGVVAEFEEDLVWRVGHLLGLDDEALRTLREANGPAAG